MSILLSLLGFFAPLAFWLWWRKSSRIVYSGRAQLHPGTRSIGMSPSHHCFAAVLVPGYSQWLLTEISRERAEQLPEIPLETAALRAAQPIEVEVVVAKRPLGKPYVVSLKWLDGKQESESYDAGGAELAAVLFYFVAGLFLIVTNMTLIAAAYLIASGFICGDRTLRGKELHAGNRIALGIMSALLGLASLVIFREPASIITLLLGLPLSFSFGQVVGMLVSGKKV